MYSIILVMLLSYLIGSFPSAVVMGRMTWRIDIREFGSKNAGGTNAFRVLGWKAGVIVALVDVGKGILAVLLVSKIRIDPVFVSNELVQILAGGSVIIGHIWTVLAKFKGGKGVATAGGVLIGLCPWAAVICLFIFLVTVFATRYVSLGSMVSASALPLILISFNRFLMEDVSHSFIMFSFFVSGLIVFKHRANIKRLLNGTENRFSKNPFNRNI